MRCSGSTTGSAGFLTGSCGTITVDGEPTTSSDGGTAFRIASFGLFNIFSSMTGLCTSTSVDP